MARKISVEIVGDARSLERAFNKSSKSARRFQGDMSKTSTKTRGAFGGITRAAGFAAGAIGTAGLISVARSAFAEFSEAQKVTAQTAAALKSTGGVANVTAKHIDDLADSMLKKTGIDDEAIKVSENLLLTFTDIRNAAGKNNKIFDRATHSVADLATAMNQGAVPSADQMQRASLQLGKALNDPVKGITALSRVGIQFTEQQKDQIKALVKSGDKIGAQKIILAELNKEVGGRAAAAGKTFAGQWKILTETLNNLSGELAAKLMPTIQKYLEMAVKWLSNSKNQKKIIDTITGVARTLKGVIDKLVGAFQILSSIVGSNKNAFKLLFGVLVAFKALQFASKIKTIADNFGLLGRNARGAKGGVGALKGSLLGKAGLVGAVGLLAYELTTAILKLTGLDKKLNNLGGRLAEKLGFADAPAAVPGGTSKSFRFLRNRASHLRASGLSTAQTAARLQRTHPGVSAHDIAIASGTAGQPIHVNVHVDGKRIATATARHNENALGRRRKQRAHARRSTR